MLYFKTKPNANGNAVQLIYNTQARRKGERTDGGRAYLDGVAIDDGGRAVYIWTIYNADGDEIGEEYTAVGDI